MKTLEDQVLGGLERISKKRVTFFISEDAKQALARWCKDKQVKESPAVEQMIRAVVPSKYFKKKE